MKKYFTPELDIKNIEMPSVMESGDSAHDLNIDLGLGSENWPTAQ